MLVSRQYQLSRTGMFSLLDRLEASGNRAVSVYLPPGLSEPDIRNLLDSVINTEEIPPNMVEIAMASQSGAMILWGAPQRLLIRPPFPLTEQYISPDCDFEPLQSLLHKEFTLALVLVRLGAFAIGVSRGEQLLTSKTGTGLVHARHRKGGSSQRRFERHRENQAHVFLERVCSHARQQVEPYARDIDYLVYGGARTTILSLKKQCPFLGQFEDHTLPPLLGIPQPRRAVLEASIKDVWSSTINEWHDSEEPIKDRPEMPA